MSKLSLEVYLGLMNKNNHLRTLYAYFKINENIFERGKDLKQFEVKGYDILFKALKIVFIIRKGILCLHIGDRSII